MLPRVQKLWDEICKPRPVINFRVVDLEVEEEPTGPSPEHEIEIIFVT